MSDTDNIQAHMNGTKADSESKATEKTDEAPSSGPVTPKQVQLIVSTWKPVQQDLQGHGIVMFTRLFEIAPDLLELFPFDAADPSLEGFRKHALDVMETVDKAIEMLVDGDIEELKDTLVELGIVHNMKNVQVESFAPVGTALIYALQKGLGDLFTDEAKVAWVGLYSVVEACMKQGMDEGLDD